MHASQYDWSYIRSELNPNDLDRIDNRILVLYNSLIVEYDFNGSEANRYDLKRMHNLSQVKSFEIDIYDVHSTTHKKHGYMKQAFYETEFDYVAVGHGAFQVVDNSALQAFQLKMSSGNINAGYFSLYGRKR